MGEYRRTTIECSFDQLHPAMAAAIRFHAESSGLGDLESQILICCETTNERVKKGWLLGKMRGGDPDPVHYTAIVITLAWFFGARTGVKAGTFAVSGRLADLVVREEDSSLIDDTGLDISGTWTESSERGDLFWGLGEGAAADHLRAVLREAMAAKK